MAKLSVTKPQSMCLPFFHLYNKKHVLGKTVDGHHEYTVFPPGLDWLYLNVLDVKPEATWMVQVPLVG